MTLIRFLIIIAFALINTGFHVARCPITEIQKSADILNIAGGRIPKRHLNSSQLWAGINFIIGSPFQKHDIINTHLDLKYPLKESSIIAYNEAQANYIIASISKHYILNGHKFLGKDSSENIKLLIYIHRNGSGEVYQKLSQDILNKCLAQTKLEPQCVNNHIILTNNVTIDYQVGNNPDTYEDFSKYDIVLSIGFALSLNNKLPIGKAVIADTFVPFDLDSMSLMEAKKYRIKNHLTNSIHQIVASQDYNILDNINRYYLSENPFKSYLKAKAFALSDFTKSEVTIESDGYFRPSMLPSHFSRVY